MANFSAELVFSGQPLVSGTLGTHLAEQLLFATPVQGVPSGTQLYKLQAIDNGGTQPVTIIWVDSQVSTVHIPSMFGGPFTNLTVLETWFV